jgi:AcrR family transcriptional regulator
MTKSRADILSTAKRLFSQSGYDRVTIDDLGAALGVTGPSLYRHFGSKLEILVTLMDYVLDGLNQAADEVTHTAGTEMERLQKLVLVHIKFVLSDPQYIRIYHHEVDRLPPKLQARHSAKSAEYHALWHGVLTAIDPSLTAEQRTVSINAAIGVVNFTAFRQKFPLPPEDQLFKSAIAALLAQSDAEIRMLALAGPAASSS